VVKRSVGFRIKNNSAGKNQQQYNGQQTEEYGHKTCGIAIWSLKSKDVNAKAGELPLLIFVTR
jgi:hypothetical protein